MFTVFSLPPDPNQILFGSINYAFSSKFTHLYGDICDPRSILTAVENAKPDVVFHLAAQPLVRVSYQRPVETWATNVNGSLHLLEALRSLSKPCSVVMVTTDKVYFNKEWVYGYREVDQLGGSDPYSASKAAMELAVKSWRSSFCGTGLHQTPHLRIASARAGNVIGGGDWAKDRIVPDSIRSLACGKPIRVRNPNATRPWQHVLEPLSGYLRLAEVLTTDPSSLCEAFNFGPRLSNNRPVCELVASILEHWPGEWVDQSDASAPREANLLNLQIDKAHHLLGWQPCWDYTTTLDRTVSWYRSVHEGASPLECCLGDLNAYSDSLKSFL